MVAFPPTMASTTTRTTLGPWYSWLRAGLHVLVPIESAFLVIVTSETPWSVPIDVGRQPRERAGPVVDDCLAGVSVSAH